VNLYGEQHPWFLRSKKGSFLSTNLFFQTLGKFNQNASQEEKLYQKNSKKEKVLKKQVFLLAQVFFL